MEYKVLAFYKFTTIDDPHGEVKLHKEFFKTRDITSRIYISEEGINGQMSASLEAAKDYMEWMHSKESFKDVVFKLDDWHEQAFPRQTVKYRKSLVGHDKPIDLNNSGKHVAPEEWKTMLEEQNKYLLIDVRNDYESKIGHFKDAVLPPCNDFRDFENYADQLKTEKDPKKTPVMMYCTGGIRCELYSAILKEKGFDEIYQLDGGVINYGHQVGSKHWLGKLFVFDDRLSVPISQEEAPIVGTCKHCNTPSDTYYNCANMDCNTLFLSCPECIKEHEGCCQKSCGASERVRPYHKENPHKPFRRKHLYN